MWSVHKCSEAGKRPKHSPGIHSTGSKQKPSLLPMALMRNKDKAITSSTKTKSFKPFIIIHKDSNN